MSVHLTTKRKKVDKCGRWIGVFALAGFLWHCDAMAQKPSERPSSEKECRNFGERVAKLESWAPQQAAICLENKQALEAQKGRTDVLENKVNSLGSKLKPSKVGIEVNGSIRLWPPTQSFNGKESVVIRRGVLAFVGDPTRSLGDTSKEIHRPHHYHIKTPLRVGQGDMYMFRIGCFAYGAGIPFAATYNGYLFAGWQPNVGPIYNGHTRISGTPFHPNVDLRAKQYIKGGYLYLKFGPFPRDAMQCVLDFQGKNSTSSVDHGKGYQVFTKQTADDDTPYPAIEARHPVYEAAAFFATKAELSSMNAKVASMASQLEQLSKAFNELSKAHATLSSTVDEKVKLFEGRFNGFDLRLVCAGYACEGNVAPPSCPNTHNQAAPDSANVTHFLHPGGACGRGIICRLCYKFGP